MSTLKVTHLQNENGTGPAMSIAVGGGVTFAGITTFHGALDLQTPTDLRVAAGATIGGSTNVITASTNGEERVRVTSGGNVGINRIDPDQKLNVNGNIEVNAYDSPSGAGGYYTAKGLIIGNAYDAGKTANVTDDRNAIIWQERGLDLDIATSDILRMKITYDGKVGIGTDNPESHQLSIHSDDFQSLQLVTNNNGTNGPEIRMKLNSASPADNDVCGQIVFGSNDDGGNYSTVARIDGIITDVTNGSEDGELVFNTRSNGSFAERMRLTSAGNLKFADGQGIDFSATAGSGISANGGILDDYEEGEFTPTLTAGGTPLTLNSSVDTMRYIRIGRQVTTFGRFQITSLNGASGALVFGGLPFTSDSTGSDQSSFNALTVYTHGFSMISGATGPVFVELSSSGVSQGTVYCVRDNNGWDALTTSNINFTFGAYMYITGSYYAAA